MTSTTAITTPRQVSAPTLKDLLNREDVRQSFAALVPRTMTPERLMKVASSTVSRSPQLAQCDAMSLLKSLAVAAELGLDPSGTLGQGYLVPFRNNKTGKMEAQFIPGYRGLVSLARRSGELVGLHAECVYRDDKFRVVKGLHPTIEHEPNYDGAMEDNDVIGAYAVAQFRDGSTQFEFMPRREIDKTRNASRAGNSGPWVTWFSEMAKKTVVRRLCKYLPLQVEEPLARAVELESRIEMGDGLGAVFAEVEQLEVESKPPSEPSTKDAAKEKMKKSASKKAKNKPATPPVASDSETGPEAAGESPADAGVHEDSATSSDRRKELIDSYIERIDLAGDDVGAKAAVIKATQKQWSLTDADRKWLAEYAGIPWEG